MNINPAISLVFFLVCIVGAAFASTCDYAFSLKMYTAMCRDELDTEWRPKLHPERPCAKLINEVEAFNKRLRDELVAVDEYFCTKEDLQGILRSAAEVLAKAKTKGWTTDEAYRGY